jgi:uncharacterized protein YecE (DUF72 family)
MSDSGKIYIGTSGWSYPRGEGSWTGYFYPTKKINELEYYSQFFNTVEINSSFYKPPSPRYVEKWARSVPEDFLFTVKLWQKFTHPGMYEEASGEEAILYPEDVDLFYESIEPLIRYGKLGALLVQFPPSFRNNGFGRRALNGIIRIFSRYNLAVELRHKSWSDDADTAELFRQNNVSWVRIDEPLFSSSIAVDLPLTSLMAYFRFHGRNREMWWKGNSETRYRYLYPPGEMEELVNKVKIVASKANQTFVFFNNHWQGYAPRNAVSMLRALHLPFKEIPGPVLSIEE